MKIYDLSSWLHFEASVRNLVKRREMLIASNHGWKFESPLYRGLGNSEWKLKTTLERAYPSECAIDVHKIDVHNMSSYYKRLYAARIELEKYTEHRWNDLPEPAAFDESLRMACPRPPLQFFDRAVWYYYFIYLRHHGLPSPLLDWTLSAYFAAFFAFDKMDQNATHVSVYAMLRGGLYMDSEENRPSDIPARYIGPLRRHFSQRCRYSLSFHWQFPCEFAEHGLAIERSDALRIGELVKWNIPKEERIVALKALEHMDTNSFSLFASDDSLVRTIGRQELLLRT